MPYRLYTLLSAIVLDPVAAYCIGSFCGWFPFRPVTYVDVVLTSFGAGFVAAGIHAILTRQMPLRGGGMMMGDKAVQSGKACLVIGSFLVAGRVAMLFWLPQR